MKVTLYDEAFECKKACVPVHNVVPPEKVDEAIGFLTKTGRFWYKINGQRFYVYEVEG